MSGRQESNIKTEQETMRLISGYPVLQDYYNFRQDCTAKGKNVYCRYIIDYFKYLAESGKNVNDYDSFTKIKMVDINRYMSTLRYYKTKSGETKEMGGSIRNARLAAIRSFYDFLKKSGFISANPCDGVSNPKVNVEKEVVYLEKEDIENIKHCIDNYDSVRYHIPERERDKVLITLAYRTGLREGALSEINLEDIDWDNNKILVTEKGNVTREVFVGDKTLEAIRNYLPYREKLLNGAACSALFVTNRKQRINKTSIIVMVKKFSELAGKKISPHKLRSTCAVNLYEKTGDIYLVKEVLGHKNVANTQRYARASVTKRREAASILDDI